MSKLAIRRKKKLLSLLQKDGRGNGNLLSTIEKGSPHLTMVLDVSTLNLNASIH